MLSIQPIKSAAAASKYYSDAVNYYLSDGGSVESPGCWYGKGAEAFGLSGAVSPGLFVQLLEGRLPSGEQLGIVDKNGEIQHRPATDLTLSAPKSFSNMALVGGDKRLIGVHNAAVRETMNVVQQMAAEARITINRKTGFEKTGNLVISLFQHTTSRESDASLHDHCLIMNMTQRSDGAWRSLSSKARDDKSHPENGFREIIYQNQHYFGLIYNSSLAKGTCDIGYDIDVKDQYGNFEIAGVPEAYIKETSKRRNQISKSLSEKGFSSAKAAEKANLDTRRSKEAIDDDSLLLYWKDEAKRFGVDFEALIDASKNREKGNINTLETVKVSATAIDAMDDALEQLSPFSTKIKHGDLVRMAYTFARGTIHHEELEQEISTRFADKRLLGVASTYYTTKALVEQEKQFIKQFKSSIGTGFLCETHQSGMAADMLRDKDRVQLIDVRGFTHEKILVEELVHASEANGYGAYVLHVGRLQRNRLNDSISRDSSSVWKWVTNLFKSDLVQTVAGFTTRYEQRINSSSKKQDVVIVHDAQKLSYQDMMSLERLTSKSQSKLILLNNTRSTEGFSAGSPIKALKDAGFKTIQSTTYEKKSTFELTESKNANQTLVAAFAGLPKDARETTQVVAHTNKSVEALTELIRAELKTKGELSLQSKDVRVLSTHMLSDVQKRNHKFFEKGDEITFKAYTREQSHYRIIGKEGDCMTLSDKSGHVKSLLLQDSDAFMVTKSKTLALSIGDRLVTEKNIYLGRSGIIERGNTFSVQDISAEGVVFTHNKTRLYFSNDELSDLSLSHHYVRKPNQLTQHVSTVMTALEGYQVNKNVLGELAEVAPHICVFTNDKERAISHLTQEKLRWTIHDVAEGVPTLVYRDSQFADPVIRKDLEHLTSLLSQDQPETDPQVIASKAVAYASAKLSEREAAFEHKFLLREAMVFAMGKVKIPDIERAIADKAATGDLIHAKTFWISKESLLLENRIIKNNVEGQGSVMPIATNARLLSLPQTLTQGQKDAVTLALTTRDRFTTVQGLAGTGKTTMMCELQRIAKEEGYSVLGLAPMHSSKDELIASGIESVTIARFLNRDTVYPDKTLFIVDESSMIGNKNYVALQDKMIGLKSRMVFAGDITQLQSPSSGIPHELTVKTETQKTAYMEEIMRQNPNPILKKAVMHASNREIKESFALLSTINPEQFVKRVATATSFPERSVVTINCRDEETKEMDYSRIYRAIANDYLTRIPEHQKNTLVIAHAHEDRAEINALIRKGLQEQGRLSTDEVITERLAQRSLESAELLSILTYKSGDVLRFDADYSVAKKGEYFTVGRVDKQQRRLHCLSQEGIKFSINPAAIAGKSRLSVYRAEKARLAEGDTIRLRLTDNARGRVANKEYTVRGVTKETALLQNDEGSLELKLNHKLDAHWDYSYTTTAFGAEGLTSKFVLALELAKRQKATTHRSHEIDVTRPKEQVTIYTENEGALIERFAKLEGDKTSAYQINELVNGTQKLISSEIANKNQTVKIENTPNPIQANKPHHVSAEEINQALLPQMDILCERLLGKPSSCHGGSLRYGSKGSLSINLNNGLWYNFETGQKGNALHLIATEMGFSDFKDTIAYAKDFMNYRDDKVISSTSSSKTRANTPTKDSPNKQAYALKLYAESRPITGTLAERYLKEHRGLMHYKDANLRFIPAISTLHGHKKTTVPAMLSIALDKQGVLNHLQVIRLDPLTGDKDRESKIIKQTYGAMKGRVVELNKVSVSEITYLAEGIETGLSILEGDKNARVMAVLSKSNFLNVDLNQLTNNVVLALDNDGDKTFKDEIIQKAMQRLMDAGKRVSVVMPEKEGLDFNDVLKQEGLTGLKNQISRPIDLKTLLNRDNAQRNILENQNIIGINKLLNPKTYDELNKPHQATLDGQMIHRPIVINNNKQKIMEMER